MLDYTDFHSDSLDRGLIPDREDVVGILEDRLQRGWSMMSIAERRNEPTDELFGHFLVLLEEYQALCDRRQQS